MNVSDHDALTRDDLRDLLTERHVHCVSLYMPFEHVGQESPADLIRLKNLVHQAIESLVARGVRRPEADAILAPAVEIAGEPLRWQRPGSGLALFLSDERAQRFRLHRRFEELAIVNDRFHIEQLLPLLDERRFYVLALSRAEVRLFEATHHTITQLSVPGMPASIEEVTKYDEYQTSARYYSDSGNRPAASHEKPMYYGMGATKDFVKRETEEFFRAVDAALFESLKLERAPLVLACVSEEVAEYRAVNRYPHLLEQTVTTGPQLLSVDDLHHRAWELVEPVFAKGREEALARFEEFAATGKASAALEEIVPAAVFGRIESLLLRAGSHAWGRFDPVTNAVESHAERLPSDEDLLDVAASYALATRGEVFSVPAEEMPQDTPAAAVFRY